MLGNTDAYLCETGPRMTTHMSGRAQQQFRSRLLGWFREHRRELPWRASRDPYRIWIAEVMLQQTRIAAVIPYYERFLARFPDFKTLAGAPQHDVLKLWSGLGYYSRARNLHAAAKKVVADFGGTFPRDLNRALELPGIGAYTAAAVLSIAYDAPLAVLDGNVARVLARLNAVPGELRAPQTWRALGDSAQQLLAKEAAGDWNQALMELGEVICTPQNPRCLLCPVEKSCRALAEGRTAEIPEPRKKRAPVNVKIAAAILLDAKGRTLLVKDPGAHDDVLFSRMWQFPAIQVKRSAPSELREYLKETLGIRDAILLEALAEVRHGVTFRNIVLLPFLVNLKVMPKVARTRVLKMDRLGSVPISSATRKIAAAVGPREQ